MILATMESGDSNKWSNSLLSISSSIPVIYGDPRRRTKEKYERQHRKVRKQSTKIADQHTLKGTYAVASCDCFCAKHAP